MNPMIEAAARAIYEEECHKSNTRPRWGGLTTVAQIQYSFQALAALRAMREVEPTDAMRKAWNDTDNLTMEHCWRALLGAIVDQGGE